MPNSKVGFTLFQIAIAFLLSVTAIRAQQATYSLKPTPKTVAWGYYDAKAAPVLRVKSGDTVEIQTLITNSPKRLEDAGLPPDQVEQSLRDITDQVKDKGPGGHILTGPIHIEDAQPGDVLEVKILAIRLAIPYAYNAFGAGRGFLPDDYPYAKIKIIPLDEKRMVAKFAPGIEIPLHPFFGSMGDAPPETSGHLSSGPPWIQAGNLDNKDLVAGTTLYIPVHAPGALFLVGDGHAGQGDGEVDITALETSLIGTFQFVVRKDMHLRWPRAETPTHYITMGLHEDLSEATKLAAREMTPFGLFPRLAQFPLIFFQSLLLFLCVLCAPASVSSVLSFSLLSSPESEKPEWFKALHTFGGFSFLLAAARKE